ncbi:hypothetical protein D3C75_1344770 [compost metagenome]
MYRATTPIFPAARQTTGRITSFQLPQPVTGRIPWNTTPNSRTIMTASTNAGIACPAREMVLTT